ncbi:flagellar export protein FliJ [Lawsonibacter sp. LCP25S3_G6]|uniref:flagellar export protein FliJ n=1 Tax=unclassified Lawsonibacter TaxID=2617946 RepID=UPI003F9E1232
MKKFQFGLDSVLGYRQQVLEGRQNEYARTLQKVAQQQDRVDDAKARYQELNRRFREEAAQGIAVSDALGFEMGLRVLEMEITRETNRLQELQAEAEQQRAKVLQAHQDAAILERLKEKQKDAYQKELQKQDERFIDELVSAVRAERS